MTTGVIITLIIVTGITIETIVNRICTHIERKQAISQKKECVK